MMQGGDVRGRLGLAHPTTGAVSGASLDMRGIDVRDVVRMRVCWVAWGVCPATGAVGVVACRLLLTVCVALAGVLVWSAAAEALIDRGHVYGYAIEGSGEHAFTDPSGIAVDEATGELYVVGPVKERVEGFEPEGRQSYAFAAEAKLDSPGAIAVDNAPGSVSQGDVYLAVSDKEAEPDERDYIEKLEGSLPEKEKVYKKDEFKVEGEKGETAELEDIAGLAVDASGRVWAYYEEEGSVAALSDAEDNRFIPALHAEDALERVEALFGAPEPCLARPEFAVGPREEAFYLGHERENSLQECAEEAGSPTMVAKFAGSQAAGIGGALQNGLLREDEDSTGVAVDDVNGDVYVDDGESVSVFASDGRFIQSFGSGYLEGAGAIAVDGASEQVFVAEEHEVVVFEPEAAGAPVIDGVSSAQITPSSAELYAQIDPHGQETEYEFQYGTAECAQEPAACTSIPVPAGRLAAGFGDQAVSVEVKGLSPASAYYYRVLAGNGLGGPVEGVAETGTFTTLPSPGVMLDQRAWELVSPVDKHGVAIVLNGREPGLQGLTQASANGDAIAWRAAGPLTSEPQGNRSLEPAQLISTRGEREWETQSVETPHEQGSGVSVPGQAEYPYFSSSLSLSLLAPSEPQRAVESPPLSGLASEKTLYVRDDPPLAPEPSEESLYLAAGEGSGYLWPGYLPLVTAANDSAGTQFGGRLEFLDATPSLDHVIFYSGVALSSSSPSAPGLYEWTPGKPLQLVSVLPDGSAAPAPALGAVGVEKNSAGGVNMRGALSQDGARVVFSEEGGAESGAERLYLHDSEVGASGETILVNAAQGHGATERGPGGETVAEPQAEQQQVVFEGASSDGSRVFFTDTARLTEDSRLASFGDGGEGPADLYELELTSAAGQPLAGRLTDLTPGGVQDAAEVLNLIPGTSEDGSYVYFVANGILAPGASQGHCPRGLEEPPIEAHATCNLYVSEPDPSHPGQREIRLIAALSYQDAADWAAGLGAGSGLGNEGALAGLSARVSPDGRYLAFMSGQSLTGYDNRDALSGEADEEVYLYDAASGRLMCASCNPGGGSEAGGWQRPHGVYDSKTAGEGAGLLADYAGVWSTGRWLAASLPDWSFNLGPKALQQPRYLSDSGRLFFDSPDDLVPAASNGKEDVYEYEPEDVGSCERSGGCIGLISSGSSDQESAFLDASENGEDVFFLTAAQLVSQDTDEAFDIYDARVCSQASPCLPSQAANPRPCETTEACRTPQQPPPSQPPPPPSATSSGPGNPAKNGVLPAKTTAKPVKPLTRAQKLATALRACRKLERKHTRAVCEKQAKTRYRASKTHHAAAKNGAKRGRSRRVTRRAGGKR